LPLLRKSIYFFVLLLRLNLFEELLEALPRQHTFSIRSAYVSIRQHTFSIRFVAASQCLRGALGRAATSAYVQHTFSIRSAYVQHTFSIRSAYVQHTFSIRQHTAYILEEPLDALLRLHRAFIEPS
jgi:hypothetical protein